MAAAQGKVARHRAGFGDPALWFVFAAALAVRLAYLLGSGDDPGRLQPLIDSRTYHELAAGLAAGRLDEQLLWQASFYPIFLGAVYKVAGVGLWAAKLVQIALGSLTCLLTARLGASVFDRRTGLTAGFITALHGPLVFFDTQLLATGWATFWTVVLVLLAAGLCRRETWWAFALLGVAGALAVLTRPTFLPVIVLLLLWLLWRAARRRGSWLRRLQGPGLMLAGLLVIWLPYGSAMRSATGHVGILPASGGINLYIGNNPDFERTINIRPGLGWEELLDEPRRNGFAPDPWSGQPYFRGQVLRFFSEEPGRALELLGAKTLHLLSSRELPRTTDIYLHRQWSSLLGALVFQAGPWGFPFGLLLPAAVVGLFFGGRRLSPPLLIVLLVQAAALVAVFMAARYRAPLVPLLAVVAAHGAWSVVRTLKAREGRRLLMAAALALVTVLVSTLPGPFVQEAIDLEGEVYFGVGYNHYQAERWDLAEQNLRRAVELDPRLAAAHNFLGITLSRREAYDEAARHFQAAVAGKADYGEAARNLERCQGLRARQHFQRARALEGEDPARALALYEDIVGFYPSWPEPLARRAWVLATTRVDSLRNGPAALAVFEDERVAGGLSDPYVMHIKAAALAACGRFAEAVALVNRARGSAGLDDRGNLRADLERAARLYDEERPWRQ